MICSAKCSCFLCRELQSCAAGSPRRATRTANMCDNFILKKAEAFESSSAMKFIRGAARLSVRHWGKDSFAPAPAPPRGPPRLGGKSSSCEQLYPLREERGNAKRAPSAERAKANNFEHKPLFRILGNSRLKTKLNNTDDKCRRGPLDFRRNESASHVHEKYVPIPHISAPIGGEHIYSEPRPRDAEPERGRAPPLYRCVEKNHRRQEEADGASERRLRGGRPPCYEELALRLARDRGGTAAAADGRPPEKITNDNNKVVIYFGDSVDRKADVGCGRRDQRDPRDNRSRGDEVIYANRLLEETANLGLSKEADKIQNANLVSEVPVPNEDVYSEVATRQVKAVDGKCVSVDETTYRKAEEVDGWAGAADEEGVIQVRFEGTFEYARRLAAAVAEGGRDADEATFLERDADATDWSFIQGWRKRPAAGGPGCRPHEESPAGPAPARAPPPALASSAAAPLLQPSRAARLRVAHPAAAARRPSGEEPERAYVTAHAHGTYVHERKPPFPIKSEGGEAAGLQLKCAAPSKTTVQSTPVTCQNPMNSYGLERKEAPGRERRAGVGAESSPPPQPPPPHHHSPADLATPVQNVPRECGSSSDENRSSGHASMSDSGGGGGEGGGARGAAGDESRARSRASSHHARARHRQQTNKLQSPWPGGGGLEDIRSAIKQLTLRSRDSTSTATSATSSATGSATGSAGDSARRRRAPLVRQPSLDTVCTNVTSADEFVWVDSHNRLVELQLVPWSAGEVSRALAGGRCREQAARMSPDTPPRLAYLLQRALVRVAREAQRLAHNFGFCSKHEVAAAFRIVLSTTLADACIKGCQRAATMFAMSGDAALRQGKAARASTQLSPGKFQRWMVDMRLAPFVHEYAAIYLCAGMESLLEEVALLAAAASPQLTPALLDAAIAGSADLWGLLQPYAHLNAGRVASGALSLSRWASLSSLGSGGSATSAKAEGKLQTHLGLSQDSGITTSGSGGSGSSGSASARSVLLTTCVGSAGELAAVLRRAAPPRTHRPTAPALPLSPHALQALYYFMRCSQLEHSNSGGGGGGSACQELWYSRAYGVLPPLGEWVRVAAAHAEARGAPAADRDDVQQAARLLLPGVDCAPRPLTLEDPLEPRRGGGKSGSGCRVGASEESARAGVALAHRLLGAGRPELVAAARALLPTGLDALDHRGLTALMKAAAAGDEHVLTMLLEAGADPNVESPGCATPHALLLSPRAPAASPASPATPHAPHSPHAPSTAGWTALVYAAAAAGAGGGIACCARLLAAGARADGAAGRSDDICTLTPLQVACGSGHVELVQLLLQHGASPFLSTLLEDSLCYSGSAQRGCYSAISVCCSHGQRACLRALLAHPAAAARHDVLSLEEILAEGAGPPPAAPAPAPALAAYTKAQLRGLQEAMYHAAETNHLDITLELRGLGVAWTLHAWMLSLAAAAEAAAEHVIDQLLQDFLQVCPSDDSHYSRTFIYDCLPLLFNIFRYSKKEGTILLLADILCACYGWEPVPSVREPPPPAQLAARIDPSFVNNPELSDVTFRVEGRLFYGHKIVLVTESPRFRALLSPARGGAAECAPAPAPAAPSSPATTQPPVVQINDIRYHIFQQVMKFLYSGGCATLDIPEADVLEVLAAASFFQLLPLQRHCEARAARALALHNLVSVYIHAKVYNAQQLLEYCQGFLLQNMVALLTYDESVKRLLFGKRLPGHNVLAALLHTLQQRIETRKNNKTAR